MTRRQFWQCRNCGHRWNKSDPRLAYSLGAVACPSCGAGHPLTVVNPVYVEKPPQTIVLRCMVCDYQWEAGHAQRTRCPQCGAESPEMITLEEIAEKEQQDATEEVFKMPSLPEGYKLLKVITLEDGQIKYTYERATDPRITMEHIWGETETDAEGLPLEGTWKNVEGSLLVETLIQDHRRAIKILRRIQERME